MIDPRPVGRAIFEGPRVRGPGSRWCARRLGRLSPLLPDPSLRHTNSRDGSTAAAPPRSSNGRNRRVSSVASRPDEGPLAEPIAGAQSCRPELVLLPPLRSFPSTSRAAQVGGKVIRPAFVPRSPPHMLASVRSSHSPRPSKIVDWVRRGSEGPRKRQPRVNPITIAQGDSAYK